MEDTLIRSASLLEFTRQLTNEQEGGLPPLTISADAAMVTALVQRLDLMNQRGTLADDWRDIKIAADELRSFLNLNASQRLTTEQNRPVAFSTRNAQTRVGLSLDLPLNRKAQRNGYRRSLINYNAGLRGLMQLEDGVKLNVRNQLRNLELARVQYPISVTQAALASEQVASLRLQLMLSLPGANTVDLLLAYDNSREALVRVANARIGYIVERARFALELEAMMLDDRGFWPQINDERYQAQPNGVYPQNAGSAYGDFPAFLRVSHEMRRMLNYPPPVGDASTAPDTDRPPQ